MPHSYGYRAGTRHKFARGFRKHGMVGLSAYMHAYKVGDFVDIKVNGAIHKGMPHKFYHGRTGVVFNVAKSAIGVIVHKRVGIRYLEKRINVRIEHVRPSKCRDDHLKRLEEYKTIREEAKASGNPITVPLKRTPKLPREAHLVSVEDNTPVLVRPVPYESLI